MCKAMQFSFASLIVVAMCAIGAMAQSTVTGAINGTVTNPNKEVIVGAAVTARNKGTNKESTTTTDDNGTFRVVSLDPGNYTLSVNASGFAPFTNDNVVVEIGRSTSLDIGLSLQGVTGTVEVTAEAPVINTVQQDFSTNINQLSLDNLPTNGRRWSNLAILTPGATPDGPFGLISFRGISGLLNNSTIDGGDNNQAFFSEERGRTRISYVISQAAIREYQVNTSNYSAEYGRAAGAVINAITKSGTNEFHGGAFFFDRNNKLGARNPTSFVFGQAYKAPDVRYQWGGSIGGPIVKDKAFFFFNYDQQNKNFPGVARFNTQNYLTTVNRTTLITRGLTDGQINAALAFLSDQTGTVPRKDNQKIFLPKVDWRITPNNTLTGVYNRLRRFAPAGFQTGATVTRDRAGFGDDIVHVDTLNLRLSSTISSKLVNEGRFQWSHELDAAFANPPLPGQPTTANGFSPQVALTNGLTFGKSTSFDRRALPDEKHMQWADTVTYSSGTHTYKFGADFNRTADVQDQLFTEAGSYSYSNINDFIVDYTNWTTNGALRTAGRLCATASLNRLAGRCYTSNYQQGFGASRFKFSTIEYALFIQDDWRITPRLTLNTGLRYEYQRFPFPFASLINPALPQTANRPDDRNNFGPRLGFAWDIKGDGKMSLRGGYGVYYGRTNSSTIIQGLIATNVPNVSQVTVSIDPSGSTTAGNPAAPIFPNILTTQPAGSATVNYFQHGFQNPLIHQGDLIFEREIARNTVISASYIFSFGKFLPNFVDVNLSPPTGVRSVNILDGPYAGQNWTFPTYFGASRPNPAFGQIQEIRSDISTKYNALVLQANRRLTRGLQFQSSYTLSRATDNGQNSQTFTPQFSAPFDPLNQQGETGYSQFDRRHKFVASVVYNTHYSNKDNAVARALLNGWTIAPIVNMFSGARVTAVTNAFTPSSTTFGRTQAGGLNGSNGSLRFSLTANNAFKQPPIKYVDLRVSRRFSIKENMKLEILGEGFNIFNRTQVSGVNSRIYQICPTGVNCTTSLNAVFDPTFLTTSFTDGFFYRERQIQVGARFEF
jgi:hypothetical protein